MKKVLVLAACGLFAITIPACKFTSCKKADVTEAPVAPETIPATTENMPIATDAPAAPAVEAPVEAPK